MRWVAWVLMAFVTVALAVACVSARTPTPVPPTPDTPAYAQPPSDWQLVELHGGWVGRPRFSLLLPPGWSARDLQGIDSYVGEVTGDGVLLHFDYGAWTSYFSERDYPGHLTARETIGGHEAQLIRPPAGGSGVTGVHFPNLDGPRLTISGSGLTPQQQETAFAIFRSVRSLLGLVKLRVNFEPHGVTLPPGTPSPSLLIDALEKGNRILATESDVSSDRLKDNGVRLHDTAEYERWVSPGTYVVDINHLGSFTSADVPRVVTVETGGVVEMEISVDTLR